MQGIKQKPLFIFGYPRSGTTLLWALLNAHSKINLTLEPELIRGMLFAGLKFSDIVDRKTYKELLEKMKGLGVTARHLSSLTKHKLSDFVGSSEDMSFKEIYEFLLPKPHNAEVWGEKSLGNIFYISKLHKIYPNAVFVHIIRDPRATLLSNYRKRIFASKPYEPIFDMRSVRFFAQGALLWKNWLAAVERARRAVGNASIIQFRYRDIVSEPKKYLRKICDAVGVDFEPEMLDAAKRKKMSKIKSEFAYAHQNIARPINPGRAVANRELPGWASYIVEKYTAEEIEKYGFSKSENQINFNEKLRIKLQLLIYNRKIQSEVVRQISIRNYAYNSASLQKFL